MKLLLIRDKNLKTIDELYDYLKMIHGKSYLMELAKKIADHEGYNITKRKEIAACPNPECGSDNLLVSSDVDTPWGVWCKVCGYRSPEAYSKHEAIRLHNLMPRKEE